MIFLIILVILMKDSLVMASIALQTLVPMDLKVLVQIASISISVQRVNMMLQQILMDTTVIIKAGFHYGSQSGFQLPVRGTLNKQLALI